MSQQLNSSRVPVCARRFNVCCAVLAALLLALVAPRASAQAACNIVYTTSPQNTSAFGAAITINNTGTTALSSWTLTWSFANGQTVSQLWNGIASQSGANVTVSNESYNGSIPAGGSLSGIGFNGTWNGVTNAVPTSFAVNGVTCGGGATGSFTLKPSASTLSIAQAGSATDTITVTDVSPFTGSVTLAASGLPSGVTATFGTNPTTGSSVVTFAASATATAGASTVTITGTSGTLTASTTIALTVNSGGSFTLKPSATTLSVAQGASGTDTITVTDVSPFTGSVTLAASGLPTGVTAAFATNPATASSVLTLTASSTATAGTSTVTITGTSGTLTASTTIALTITAAPSFTLAPSASTLSVAPGSSGTDTITVTDLNGFTGSVTLAASGLPSGVTATFGTNPTTGSSVLTLTASSTATAGTATVTITGTSGTLSKTTSIALTVTGTSSVACKVGYTISPQSSGAFGAAIAIDNTGTTSWTNWTLTWTFANGQTVASLWNGVESQSGANVTVANESYNGSIAAGSSYSGVGFNGTWNGVTNAVPVNFAINGTTCGGSGSGGGFTLAPSASTLSLSQGSSATDTVTVTDSGGFTGSVTLAASGLPSGVTAAFATNPTTGSSVVTFTASATVAAATSTVTITGTSGAVTASTTIALTVAGTTTVAVDQASGGPAVTDQLLGMNMAAWYDIFTNESAIVTAFQTAGIKAVRWPGGSWSDIYHWQTNTNCFSSTDGAPDTDDTFTNFVSDLAIPAGVDVALTADYGTDAACTGGGLPSEAAAWVTAALADGITVSHMTVGNEEYGTWEEDLHSSPNNPTTYAAAVIGTGGYYQAIKAASPNTLVGVVVDADNTTGGWDNTVLANAKGSYDFVEYHYYPEAPGSENDTTLIQQDAQLLTTNINTLKSELAKWGTPNTPIYVGEMGSVYSNPGKQSWSITQGLFAGQVLGEMMNDGVSRSTWWIGFGNCNATAGNDSTSLYGWQDFGAYNIFSDGPTETTCPGDGAIGSLSPTARAFQLFSSMAVNGESVLTTGVSGDTTDVVAYAATNAGGTALMLFNRNETTSEPVTITLSAQTTAKTVTVETYDKAIYDLSGSPSGTPADPAGTSTWAPPTTTTISSPALPLTLTLPPWSMNVVMIH